MAAMRFHVSFEVRPEITNPAMKPLRGVSLARFTEHPKVLDMGVYADTRGGYLVFEVDSAEEIMEFLGPELLDNAAITLHPIAPRERVRALFERWRDQDR